jgi:hypothetical protein
MGNEVIVAVEYLTMFAAVYGVNKALELAYIQRHEPVDQEELASIANRITELRREGGLKSRLAARSLENIERGYRSRQEETPLSTALRKHHDQLRASPGTFIVRELTTFPTFKSWYETAF